ncbi:MAG: hypothetical protein HY686_01695, partial [Chloroflexi bacterium]|nr:hypothetical protein [Chloroflexota bacterium]
MQERERVGRPEQQIGKMLVEGGFLSEEQLTQALAEARKQNKSLRELLAEKQIVNPETYTTFL